jgi:hypothetical protein
MERQYPPFGQIPGPVPSSPHIIRQTPRAALSLTAFHVLPTGLLASMRTLTRDTALLDVTYSFEAMSAGEQTQLEVWVAASQGDGDGRIAANLTTGSRGQDEGIDSRVYTLWFPIDLADTERALTVYLTWAEAGIERETVAIEPSDIQAALALAYLP